MADITNNIRVFIALLQAGLWGKKVELQKYGTIDYSEILRLAEEQSVVGLIAEGIEHITDLKPAKKDVVQFIAQTMQLEKRNQAMNSFISMLVDRMRKAGIYALLIKGQGVAQCYTRPLWRSSGDVDFYLTSENYKKAKSFFRPLVESFDPDNDYTEHICMHYDSWVVEIHANQHCSLSSRIDRVMDDVHKDLFYNGNVRSWIVDDTTVFLPSPDDDAIIIFSHFLKHFYKGGLGLRQLCDWCRLLWTFKDSIDTNLLKERLRKMGAETIWKSFAALAVDRLGMPSEAMPLYSCNLSYKRKAKRIFDFVLEVGNFGHNRDTSYYRKYPRIIRKFISLGYRIGDIVCHSRIFPLESIRFFPKIIYEGVRLAARGE